jgi:copper homeostasis protein
LVSNPCLLEISVETGEAAMAAERGGAHRIELCAALAVGGVTPGRELMSRVREQVRLPIYAMIRPRGGDFVYSTPECEGMVKEIAIAKRLGMNGVVFGLLTKDRRVDVQRTKELVEEARPLAVTFHRAYDACVDLLQSLEHVIETGAARILTSGGALTAPEGLGVLSSLVTAAQERIIVLPGGGINASNIANVAQGTGAREFHSGLGSVMAYGRKDYKLFENEVRKLTVQLAGPS